MGEGGVVCLGVFLLFADLSVGSDSTNFRQTSSVGTCQDGSWSGVI